MPKTAESVTEIHHAWYARIADINRRCKHDPHGDAMRIQLLVACSRLILEEGLTEETIEAFIENQIDEFETKAVAGSRNKDAIFRLNNRRLATARTAT